LMPGRSLAPINAWQIVQFCQRSWSDWTSSSQSLTLWSTLTCFPYQDKS
jgi:hypothetical protein